MSFIKSVYEDNNKITLTKFDGSSMPTYEGDSYDQEIFKIAFLDINKIIMAIIKDSNYKKYAVKNPSNIKQIYQIDFWARSITINKINKNNV